ncbi:MAG: aminopeptidase P family protein [Desulfobacterales bacterium]|nr:MAG: aminopeptidase P family protein [Desulfobacterales bacterium]
MPAEINHEEYVSRQNRAQKLMQAADIQALLVTDPTNLFYFTGASYFGEMSYPRPAALLIPREKEAMLLTHDFHLAVPWQGDVREYPKVGELPVDMLKDMFSDAGCESGRIGMELGREQRLGMSYSDFRKVRAALPEIIPVDAAGMIWDTRMQKSDAEIAIIQQACKIHDDVFKKVFDAVKAGMTTREIEQLFRMAIAESESDSGWAVVCVGDFDEHQASGPTHPDKVLQADALLWVDLGIVLRGYHTDYCRGLVVGALSETRKELWDKVQQVLLAGIESVKAGIPVSAVYQAQLSKAEELGLDMQTWKARRFGHGSGLHTTEPPYISGDDHTILKQGVILHIEPGCIQKDGIYVREEQVLVTETGCKVLSNAPWQLSA